MPQSCPGCGSTNFKLSKVRGPLERLGLLLGYQPARCRECDQRMNIRIWGLDHLIYAKCPRCHKMDLTKWSTTRYRPDSFTTFKLTLGAKPVRCEYCRCNFASWKAIKERFSYAKRAERSQILIPVSSTEKKTGKSSASENGPVAQSS